MSTRSLLFFARKQNVHPVSTSARSLIPSWGDFRKIFVLTVSLSCDIAFPKDPSLNSDSGNWSPTFANRVRVLFCCCTECTIIDSFVNKASSPFPPYIDVMKRLAIARSSPWHVRSHRPLHRTGSEARPCRRTHGADYPGSACPAFRPVGPVWL